LGGGRTQPLRRPTPKRKEPLLEQQNRAPAMRILALHAHPDDLEFQCAGTLALLAQAGDTITMATMTAGDCGSAELSAEKISAIRREEARRSADVIGAAYECLEFADLSIVIDNDAKRRVTELIRRIRPDLVITAPPADYMDDHEATSRLARDGCFNASCPNYETQHAHPVPPTERIPHLYYVDPLEGLDLWREPVRPHFCVDVTAVYATKQQMLACHESQRSWLRAQHGIDEYLESMHRWSAKRGSEVGVERAEGFRQHRGHPYPAENLLAERLGPLVRNPDY
jgi:LmbE family N-acetylglucosaminyl deacetylase